MLSHNTHFHQYTCIPKYYYEPYILLRLKQNQFYCIFFKVTIDAYIIAKPDVNATEHSRISDFVLFLSSTPVNESQS